ncbi:Hypothetical protein PHPALM_2258, partial [Phytophthora palmivora]
GAVSEPQEISNDLDKQQERYQAAQLQGTPVPPTPVYPHGYYPPDVGSGSPMFLDHLKAPRGLNHGCTSRGAYERALVQGSVNTGTVHRKAAKKPRTTYAPAVADPKSQQPSGSQPGAGLPAPTSSVTRGNLATFLVR